MQCTDSSEGLLRGLDAFQFQCSDMSAVRMEQCQSEPAIDQKPKRVRPARRARDEKQCVPSSNRRVGKATVEHEIINRQIDMPALETVRDQGEAIVGDDPIEKLSTPDSKARVFETVKELEPVSPYMSPASSLASAAKEIEGQQPSKRYRKAKESADSVIEVLCFSCRRSEDTKVQKSMTDFFKKRQITEDVEFKGNSIDLTSNQNETHAHVDMTVCSKCRRSLVEKGGPVKLPTDSLKGSGELPQLKRLKGYRRTADRQGVPFTISEKNACAIMRGTCIGCGSLAPQRGHGLTRLRKWPLGIERPERGGFMGPFADGNLAAACTMCNMMKGFRKLRGFVEACRHIASKHTPGEHFGEFPNRFRDNVSRRSRSCYIANSSTHTKTHAITNKEFNSIVSNPCYYCHKKPRPPKTLGPDDRGHFNGLDRLESSNRVYTTETTVACCGDCNIMKYRWPLDGFLEHCRKVARFQVGAEFSDEDMSEEGASLCEDVDSVADEDGAD